MSCIRVVPVVGVVFTLHVDAKECCPTQTLNSDVPPLPLMHAPHRESVVLQAGLTHVLDIAPFIKLNYQIVYHAPPPTSSIPHGEEMVFVSPCDA